MKSKSLQPAETWRPSKTNSVSKLKHVKLNHAGALQPNKKSLQTPRKVQGHKIARPKAIASACSWEENQPFAAEQTRWPEMAQYTFDHEAHELRIFQCEPGDAEIGAVRTGDIEVVLEDGSALCVLKFRFAPEAAWQTAPVAWWLLPSRHDSVPPSTSKLRIVLIDSRSGLVKAVGVTKLPVSLKNRLANFLRLQSQSKFGMLEMDRQFKVAIGL